MSIYTDAIQSLHGFGVWLIVLILIQDIIVLAIAFTVCCLNNERRVVRQPRWRTANDDCPRRRC